MIVKYIHHNSLKNKFSIKHIVTLVNSREHNIQKNRSEFTEENF